MLIHTTGEWVWFDDLNQFRCYLRDNRRQEPGRVNTLALYWTVPGWYYLFQGDITGKLYATTAEHRMKLLKEDHETLTKLLKEAVEKNLPQKKPENSAG